jgi:hypothetical protein
MSSYFLQQGQRLTTNKYKEEYLNPSNFQEITWFRPPWDSEALDCYGPLKGIYITNRRLNLLNLGNKYTRQKIKENTNLNEHQLDPDEQYCGHNGNLIVHQAIFDSSYFKRFDGTIISSDLTDPDLRDYLEGPEEVVLFMDRARWALTLSEIENNLNRLH